MDHGQANTLEARVARLERANRAWRLAAVVASGAALALAVGGQPMATATAKAVEPSPPRAPVTSQTMEAQRFVLRDASGVTRATLALGEDGEPVLFFLDRDGIRRAALGPTQVSLSDDGGTAVKLLVNPGGSPALRLEREGRLRAVLGMTGGGTLALGFYGQDGKGRALLDVGPDGSPGLTLFDRTGKVTWSAP